MACTCPYCKKNIYANQAAIQCTGSCMEWVHANCAGLSKVDLSKFEKDLKNPAGDRWTCNKCGCNPSAEVQHTHCKDMNLTDAKIEEIMEKLLQKHFTSFESKLMAAIKTCTESLIQLESKIQILESENAALKIKLDQLPKTNLEDLYLEFDERQKRKLSFIMFNVEEKTEEHDNIIIKDVLTNLAPETVQMKRSYRIGKKVGNKIRPIRVILSEEEHVHAIIKHSKALKDMDENLKNITIAYDKTKTQQLEYKNVKTQLVERTAAGEKNLKIKYVGAVPKIVQNLN